MKDNSRSQYQDTLDKYGLKQKPLRHYIKYGSIHFSVEEGRLFYQVTMTIPTPYGKFHKSTCIKTEVANKEILGRLLSSKTIHDIQALELVIQ